MPQQPEGPQQALPSPDVTRRAASPYFSWTISFTLCVLTGRPPLFAADDLLRLHFLFACAAFGIEKNQQFLKGFRIGRVPKECALAAHLDEVLMLQLFEVMGKRAGRYLQLTPDLAHNQPFRMSAQEKAHDPQTRLRPYCREHIGVAGRQFSVVSFAHSLLLSPYF